jgi:hypothetical protein
MTTRPALSTYVLLGCVTVRGDGPISREGAPHGWTVVPPL